MRRRGVQVDTHLFPDSKMGSRFLLTAMASSKKASSRSGATPSAVKSRSTRCAEPSKAPKRARCKGGEGYQRECTMSGGSPRYGSHAERRVGRDSEWERDNASRWEECEIREAWLELDKVPPPNILSQSSCQNLYVVVSLRRSRLPCHSKACLTWGPRPAPWYTLPRERWRAPCHGQAAGRKKSFCSGTPCQDPAAWLLGAAHGILNKINVKLVTSRRRASHRARKGLVCCCPIA